MPWMNELAKSLSLDGEWDFCLGPAQTWGKIQVPGCWEAQGYPKELDGPACYRRSIIIPADWSREPSEHIFIEFGAVGYACTLRCNGQPVGEHLGMWTPFAFDISAAAQPGAENLFELEVFKPGERYPMRETLAGFLPDVATSFGGIWQSVQLRAAALGWEDLRIEADPASGAVHLRGRVRSFFGAPQPGTFQISIRADVSGNSEVARLSKFSPLPDQDGAVLLDEILEVNHPDLWSPAHPALYSLQARCEQGKEAAVLTRRFGFRTLEASDGQVRLNGQPILLRGLLSWGWQPDVIAPAYTLEQARAEMRRVKALGFNLIKLCLFVPNPGYFEVADEEGILLWEELPLWLPEVTERLRATAPGEYAQITSLVCAHPSVAVYSLGCELNRSVDAALIENLNTAVRSQVRGVLVCDNSGSGESYGGLDFDFADFSDYHPYYDLHYFEPLLDNWRRDWLPKRPWIFGEFSDADGYRDLAELRSTNGGQKPWWMTADNPVTTWRPEAQALVEAEERLTRANLGVPNDELVRIAAAQALTARKYTLEALRKRAGMGGYVITGLRDTPIATSGVFDDLERPKSPPADWLPFNADAILCLEVGRRRSWTHGGDRPAPLDVHNHWAGSEAAWRLILSAYRELPAGAYRFSWRLRGQDGSTLAAGGAEVTLNIQPGTPMGIGSIDCLLPKLDSARELRLEVRLDAQRGEVHIFNTWPVWVYPRADWPAGLGWFDPGGALDGFPALAKTCRRLEHSADWDVALVIAAGWSERLDAYLRAGGRVVLLQQGDNPLPAWRGPFWREGLKIFAEHPLWNNFPHQGSVGMQFFGLASDVLFDTAGLAQAFPDLEAIQPVLRRLDEREFHMKDYIFEARLGSGRLLACSLRLQGGLGAQPGGLERNVAGAYLLQRMIAYLTD